MGVSDLIAALTRREAYRKPPHAEVGVTQTHISVLFFTEDRVYKVKKPIKLDFLDYSTLERRRHFCEEEVRLNHALAPGVYLGVTPITRDAHGVVRIAGPGATIDHAVEMVRLPADRMMSALLERGEIDNHQVEEIADRLAGFHGEAATGPGVDEFGAPAQIASEVEENFSELMMLIGRADQPVPLHGTISNALHDHLRSATRNWLDQHRDLLEQRVRGGRIREGHGDLHAGNICLTRDEILIYDRIEFSRRFRCRDVACDLAFLAMDLDLQGFRGFARYLLHRYAALTGDQNLPRIADFYKLHLATVRGKVGCLRAADSDLPPDQRQQARREAMRYFHLAASYTLSPLMILMCGLPASGKSHAAKAIARPFEATVLRSDVVRKQMTGLAGGGRGEGQLDAGLYAPQFTRRTYEALRAQAVEHLRHRRTVIADATFPTAALRKSFFDAAREIGVPCLLVEMTSPEEVIHERMRDRAGDPDEVSDADWRVYLHAKVRFEPPQELSPAQHLSLDSRQPAEEIAGAVIDHLIRHS